MTRDERSLWNARYEAASHAQGDDLSALTSVAAWIPHRGRALDLAAGRGTSSLWLARRGLDVTWADISDVAESITRARAEAASVVVHTLRVNLREAALPAGPWDVVLCRGYVQPGLWPAVADALAPGGVAIYIHPTRANLTRHERPPERFLLAPGEGAALLRGTPPTLDVVVQRESWWPDEAQAEARHLARVVARNPT